MRMIDILRTAGAMVGPARPVILYHKPTLRCDCRCRFCDSWVHQPKEDDTLPTTKILPLLDRAKAAGMTMYTLWGGEPLLAEDLPVWLRHATSLKLRTVVCTSGGKLAERAREIAPATQRLLLSLEGIGEKHDKIRGTTGLFGKLVAGLEEFRRHSSGEVTLWSNLTRENRDQIEDIARFAARRKVFVEFFPAARYAGFNDEIILSPPEREEAFRKVMELKRRGYPVHNTWYSLRLMRTSRHFKCNIPRLSVQLNADGNLYACDPKMLPDLEPYGALDTFDLRKLPSSDAYRRIWRQLQNCNRCLLPCVAHLADNLLFQGTRKALNQVYYREDFFNRSTKRDF